MTVALCFMCIRSSFHSQNNPLGEITVIIAIFSEETETQRGYGTCKMSPS